MLWILSFSPFSIPDSAAKKLGGFGIGFFGAGGGGGFDCHGFLIEGSLDNSGGEGVGGIGGVRGREGIGVEGGTGSSAGITSSFISMLPSCELEDGASTDGGGLSISASSNQSPGMACLFF